MNRPVAESLLQRLHAAQNAMYAGGDIEPVRSLLTEDVLWSVPGENAIAGRYRGTEEVLAYFGRRRRLAGDTLRLYPGEVLVGEGQHLAALHGWLGEDRGRRAGLTRWRRASGQRARRSPGTAPSLECVASTPRIRGATAWSCSR